MFLFASEKKQSDEDDFQEPISERPILFTEVMSTLVANPARADVIFTVSGEGGKNVEIPAHRLILAASSPLFAAMFYPPKVEGKREPVVLPVRISIPDTDEDVFKSFLQSVYTDTTDLDSSNVFGLLKLSIKYCIEKLNILCHSYLDKDVCAENVIDLFTAGPELRKPDLGLAYIRAHTASVFSSDDLLRLSEERLLVLVKDQQLDIQEGQLFAGVLRWAQNQVEKTEFKGDKSEALKKTFAPFLPYISFGSMPLSALAQYVEPSGLFDEDELLDLYKYAVVDDEEKSKMDFKYGLFVRAAISLVFSDYEDMKGLFYYLGTQKAKTYSNPITQGLVTCAMSSGSPDYSNLADRQFLTKPLKNSYGSDLQPWLSFTFTSVFLRVSDIVIYQERDHFLTNWRLEGKKGASDSWTCIRSWSSDQTISKSVIKRGRFSVASTQFYDNFRILVHGPSQAGSANFDITQVEFYGAVKLK